MPKNGLSKLLRLLEIGKKDCIVIARHNKPVAKVTVFEDKPTSKRAGIAKGKAVVSNGWESPELDNEIAAMFGLS